MRTNLRLWTASFLNENEANYEHLINWTRGRRRNEPRSRRRRRNPRPRNRPSLRLRRRNCRSRTSRCWTWGLHLRRASRHHRPERVINDHASGSCGSR